MRRRSVPWDGADPKPGEYLAGPVITLIWRIQAVTPKRRPDAFGARLLLELEPVRRSDLPDGAVLHPAARAAAVNLLGPPRVQQLAGEGETAVMRTAWRDPEDMRPNAREAREITFFRRYCPLRRMQAQHGARSQITERHILAADWLRQIADLTRYGLSGERDNAPVLSIAYGPRAGPSAAALISAIASREFRRAILRFTVGQRLMLTAIVLLNQSVNAWCEEHAIANPQIEMGRLLAILDLLAEHCAAEIDAHLAEDGAVAA